MRARNRPIFLALFLSAASAIFPSTPPRLAWAGPGCNEAFLTAESAPLPASRQIEFEEKIEFQYRKTRADWSSGENFADPAIRLGTRAAIGEGHARMLLKLGATIVPARSSGRLEAHLHLPERFSDILSAAERIIQEWKNQGSLTEEQTLRPAVAFENQRTGRVIYARPGFDPFPRGMEWEVVSNLSQIRHRDWEDALSEGRIPFALGGFINHDLAHLTELLESPAMMKAVRGYYQWAAKQPEPWRELIAQHLDVAASPGLESRALDKSSLDATRAWRHAQRIKAFAEFLTLPDLAHEPAIRNLIPELFEPGARTDFESHLHRLRNMPIEALTHRAASLYLESLPLIRRQGGGMRDTFNFEGRFGDPDGIEQRLRERIENPSLPIEESYDAEKPPYSVYRALSQESLLGMRQQIAMLLLFHEIEAKSWSLTRRKLKRIDDMLRDRMARMEIAFYAGVTLRITPEQIVLDQRGERLPADSVTARYFAAFAPQGSVLGAAYEPDRDP